MTQARTNMLADDADSDRHGVGGNKPPSTLEMLKSDLQEVYGSQIAEAAPIADRANAAPEVIASDEDLATWAKIGVDAATLFKSLDAARLNEKRPIVGAVDDFFKNATERLDRVSKAATQRATIWNRKKAEAARAKAAAEAELLRKEAEDKRIAAQFEIDESAASVAAGEAAAIETQIAMTPKQSAADLTRTRTDDGILSTTRTDWKFEIEDASKIDLNAIRAFIDPKAIGIAIGKIVKIQKGATKIDGVRVFEEETAQFRA